MVAGLITCYRVPHRERMQDVVPRGQITAVLGLGDLAFARVAHSLEVMR